MSIVLHTEGLAVGYAPCAVVEDVTVRFTPGQMVAVIGVNGSGKSTLLRTLAGLQKPIAGRIDLDGRPMHTLSAMQRSRQIAMVLTGRPNVGILDVRTLVSLGRQPWTGYMGRCTAADEHAVDEALRHTGLTSFARRGMDMLSDGERQKVMIARALAQDTPILLLDEPTAYLDLVNRVQIVRLLQRIAHELGKVVVLSSHDLRLALDLADRLLVLHHRRAWIGSTVDALSSGVLEDAFQAEGLVFDQRTGSLR